MRASRRDMLPTLVDIGSFQKKIAGMDDRREFFANATDFDGPTPFDFDVLIQYDLISFDAFDTILLRDDIPEAERYYDTSSRMAKSLERRSKGAKIDDDSVFIARYLATATSYRHGDAISGCREGHIDEIITGIIDLIGVDKKLKEPLKAIELDYEMERLSLNSSFEKLIAELNDIGKQTIIVSDMYLCSDSIAKLILKAGWKSKFLPKIVSSAETKVSKRSGIIFDHIAKANGVSPSRCIHIGDSLAGDVRSPSMHGWASCHFPVSDAELRRRSDRLKKFANDHQSISASISQFFQV